MPNHFTTIAICSPGHDFDAGKFNEQHKQTNLCALIKAMPEPLEEVSSGSCSIGGKRVSRWRDTPDGPVEVDEEALLNEFGAADWHDWAIENWGTKWGTYDAEAFSLGGDGSPIAIKFQSAWGPPAILDKIASWLCKTYGFEKVAFVGFDPFDDETKLLETFKP